MAANEEGEGTDVRGNEWEVVSLTASAYAAAPGPKQVELDDNDNDNTVGKDEPETSHAMFMSGHFVFPPCQRENLPLSPENIENIDVQESENIENIDVQGVQESEDIENIDVQGVQESENIENIDVQGVQESDGVPEVDHEKYAISDNKDEENWNIKGLTLPDEFSGIQFLDDKDSKLSIQDKGFEGETTLEGLSLVEKEHSIYTAAKLSSFHETNMGGSTTYDDEIVIPELIESDQGLDPDISQLPKQMKEENPDGPNLPCEAWWKRQASAMYANAKEANAFWSIFIAAAVMGLVILGQKWQQDRWQVLQLRWQFSIKDEKMGRMMMGPISRLKDIVAGGGSRRGSLIRGSSSNNN